MSFDEMQAPLGEPTHRLRIDTMFLRQHARRQMIGIVAVDHRYGGLDNDRTVIKRRRYEVHGTPVDAHARVKRR